MEENLLTILARRWGGQKAGESPRSAADAEQTSRRSFALGIVVSTGKGNSSALAQAEVLGQLVAKSNDDKTVADPIILQSCSGKRSGRLRGMFEYFRRLTRVVRSVELIHVITDSYLGWWVAAFPAAVVGCFYRRPIVIEATGRWAAHLSRWQLFLLRGWTGICRMILVPAGQSTRWLEVLRVAVEESAPMVDLESVQGRKLTVVQPSILADCSTLSVELTDEIIAGFEIVKQKYPRTELTILVDNQYRRTGSSDRLSQPGLVVKTVGAGFRIENLSKASEIFVSCRTEPFAERNILMAAASGNLILTGKSSMLSEYLRRECHFDSITFAGRSELADSILQLIENPGMVENLSSRARGLAERFACDNLNSVWFDRYHRVQSD